MSYFPIKKTDLVGKEYKGLYGVAVLKQQTERDSAVMGSEIRDKFIKIFLGTLAGLAASGAITLVVLSGKYAPAHSTFNTTYFGFGMGSGGFFVITMLALAILTFRELQKQEAAKEKVEQADEERITLKETLAQLASAGIKEEQVRETQQAMSGEVRRELLRGMADDYFGEGKAALTDEQKLAFSIFSSDEEMVEKLIGERDRQFALEMLGHVDHRQEALIKTIYAKIGSPQNDKEVKLLIADEAALNQHIDSLAGADKEAYLMALLQQGRFNEGDPRKNGFIEAAAKLAKARKFAETVEIFKTHPEMFQEEVLKNDKLGSDDERAAFALRCLEMMGEKAFQVIAVMDKNERGFPYYNRQVNLLMAEAAKATGEITDSRAQLMARMFYAKDYRGTGIFNYSRTHTRIGTKEWDLVPEGVQWSRFLAIAASRQDDIGK